MKTQKKKITIWSDFACPYCYIGERRLKDAIRELDADDLVEIEYRAFELDPDAPLKTNLTTEERLMGKYNLTSEEAKKKIESIDLLAKDLGIEMKFGKTKHTSTFTAHRLMKFAESDYEPAVVEALNEALFNAYFVKNQSLADEKLLLEIAESCGMDPTQCNEVVRSKDMFASQVRYDEREAAERGVQGVPYMLFDGEIAVPGAISTDDCKTVIREILGREKGIKHASGPECDANGCAVKG